MGARTLQALREAYARLRRGLGLPLQVARLVRPAALQGNDMIYHLTWGTLVDLPVDASRVRSDIRPYR